MPARWQSALAKTVTLGALLTCFGLHAHTSIAKFLSRQMTMALKTETFHSVAPPTLSFCPSGKNDTYVYTEYFLRENEGNVTEEDVITWWHQRTFDLSEFLIDVSYPTHSESVASSSELVPGTISSDRLNLTITEVSTLFGRCYSLFFDCSMRPTDYLALNFSLSPLRAGKMVLFAHSRHDEVGLNDGYWPEKPAAVTLHKSDVSYVFSKGFRVTHESDHGCNADPHYSRPECVVSWAREKYESMGIGCWFPEFGYLSVGLPACTNYTLVRDSWSPVFKEIISKLDDGAATGCLPSCRRSTLVSTKLEQPVFHNRGDGTAELYVYVSATVETAEEYLLFDANAIVASVGGSLGLFLGFSCFSIFNLVGRKITDIVATK